MRAPCQFLNRLDPTRSEMVSTSELVDVLRSCDLLLTDAEQARNGYKARLVFFRCNGPALSCLPYKFFNGCYLNSETGKMLYLGTSFFLLHVPSCHLFVTRHFDLAYSLAMQKWLQAAFRGHIDAGGVGEVRCANSALMHPPR